MFQSKTLGQKGEAAAVRWYRKQGYRVRAKNYRTRQGEIDVIVQKENTLVFVEVKTRSANAIAPPRAFVTPSKQRKLLLAARAYVAHLGTENFLMRFDVMEVMQTPHKTLVCNCIENAFFE